MLYKYRHCTYAIIEDSERIAFSLECTCCSFPTLEIETSGTARTLRQFHTQIPRPWMIELVWIEGLVARVALTFCHQAADVWKAFKCT